MKTFIIPRRTYDEYNHMLKVWHWYEVTFDKNTYLNNAGLRDMLALIGIYQKNIQVTKMGI